MRTGLMVVAGCLVASVVIAFALKSLYKEDLSATQELAVGLIYYIEASGGQFPASREAFLASPYVEQDPNGTIRVRGNPDSNYRRQTQGVPIADLEPFEIAWGADLASLEIDERGRVRDPNGRPVELIRWPSSPPSGKAYSRLLVLVGREVRARAASRPAGE